MAAQEPGDERTALLLQEKREEERVSHSDMYIYVCM